MAARALAAVAGRRVSGAGSPALASCRRWGGAMGYSRSSAQQREEDGTAAQVEAALNRKNVEVVVEDGRSATVLPDEAVDVLRGVGAAEAEHAWVPDQDTGVFVPAEEAAAAATGPQDQQPGPSVLDQAVFVREDMEDVERPAVDMDANK